MIVYDFIWRRLDQVECSDGWHAAQYMVDGLWDANYLTFKQEDSLVKRCMSRRYTILGGKRSLEVEIVANEDIPF